MYWDDPTAFYSPEECYRRPVRHGAVLFGVRELMEKAAALSLPFVRVHARVIPISLFPDIPMTLLFVMVPPRGGPRRTYIHRGGPCGLSASLGFNSLIIVFPLIAHLLRESRQA
jgi:hypothetical protein